MKVKGYVFTINQNVIDNPLGVLGINVWWALKQAIGNVTQGDLNRQVYRMSGPGLRLVLQVENDEQRASRMARDEKLKLKGNSVLQELASL